MLADHAHELARRYAEAGKPPPAEGSSEESRRALFDDWTAAFAEAFLVLKQAFNQAVGREDLEIQADMVRRTFSRGVSLTGIRYRLAGRQWVVESVYPELRVYRIADLSAHPGEPLFRFALPPGPGARMGMGALVLDPRAAALAVLETLAG